MVLEKYRREIFMHKRSDSIIGFGGSAEEELRCGTIYRQRVLEETEKIIDSKSDCFADQSKRDYAEWRHYAKFCLITLFEQNGTANRVDEIVQKRTSAIL